MNSTSCAAVMHPQITSLGRLFLLPQKRNELLCRHLLKLGKFASIAALAPFNTLARQNALFLDAAVYCPASIARR
jgi:hypothetical protein